MTWENVKVRYADLRQFAAVMSRVPPIALKTVPERRSCERCRGSLSGPGRSRYCSRLCALPVSRIYIRNCAWCKVLFVGRDSHVLTCGERCSRERGRQQRNARKRHREYLQRATVSDISPEQEAAMRLAARRCPLCSVRMTAEANRPNSKHLDHILPVSQGGTHTHGNVRIICATCNLTRPRDGSDAGQITLWAQGEIPVSRKTCKSGLHPWVPENIVFLSGQNRCIPCHESRHGSLLRCRECGAPTQRGGRAIMCPGCLDEAARRAAELHAGGMKWVDVAAEVGYTTGEGARYAAKRIGYEPLRRAS